MNNNNDDDDEIIMFNSMLELTDFILYDNNQQDECIFTNINENEINEIKLICNELDLLYDDLNEINAKLIKYKQSYRIYCDNLLKLLDDKDKLVVMFLDYYNEYIEEEEEKQQQPNIKRTKSKNKKSKTSLYSYAVPVENRFGILSIKNIK
jgi:hypothetical protein